MDLSRGPDEEEGEDGGGGMDAAMQVVMSTAQQCRQLLPQCARMHFEDAVDLAMIVRVNAHDVPVLACATSEATTSEATTSEATTSEAMSTSDTTRSSGGGGRGGGGSGGGNGSGGKGGRGGYGGAKRQRQCREGRGAEQREGAGDGERRRGLLPLCEYSTSAGIGLFPAAARFNHSCRNNCTFRLLREGHHLVVSTTSDIAQGDELCVSYVDPLIDGPSRRSRLKRFFGFDCGCGRCKGDPVGVGDAGGDAGSDAGSEAGSDAGGDEREQVARLQQAMKYGTLRQVEMALRRSLLPPHNVVWVDGHAEAAERCLREGHAAAAADHATTVIRAQVRVLGGAAAMASVRQAKAWSVVGRANRVLGNAAAAEDAFDHEDAALALCRGEQLQGVCGE